MRANGEPLRVDEAEPENHDVERGERPSETRVPGLVSPHSETIPYRPAPRAGP